MRLFDYIFYRAYLLFGAENGREANEKAALAVAVLLGLFVDWIAVIFIRQFELLAPRGREDIALIMAIPIVCVALLVYLRYLRRYRKDNYAGLRSRWDSEDSRTKRIRGWLVVGFIVLDVVGVPVAIIKLGIA